ncbi:enoyl-CoA hydratase/isomerase family protein [Henriciella barbarensis]|uniref:Enoyl-CoA hydratase/isomerase family protein n=1 Tax=Henriciella barbarensis TaxID=86342 RepID=A0A399R324_9PROT|nr:MULTISPECIES: enoyl-CoA hydratase/isomerase family protein [Henriciella]RIJ24625.1 enoyl-CoA hydratase/isomerase family protein [Henriciella barbarensis]
MARCVDLSIENGLARLTLVNGNKGNPLDHEFGAEIRAAAIRLEGTHGLRAVLLTGEGKNFSVGGDLGAFSGVADLPAYVRESTADYHVALSKLMRLRAPIISAVQGACAGAGVTLACFADFVVATENSSFCLAYTSIGFSPDGASTYVLPRLIGTRKFQELVYTNRRISASEALQIGLVTQLVPSEQLTEQAEKLARQFADGPTGAFAATKRLLFETYSNSFETQLEWESRLLSEQCASEDVIEGISAALSRRPPQFTGR